MGSTSPYHAILGDAFETLHPNVRRAHEAPLTAAGTFDVVYGTHRLTSMLVALMKLPAAGRHVPVTLRVGFRPTRTHTGPPTLTWDRRIGQTALRTHQRAHRGFLVEEQGPGRMTFALRATGGCLLYEHAALRFSVLRVPRLLSPRVRARVSPDPEGWHVDVRVEWKGHLICTYGGCMRPLDAPS